MSKVIEIIKCDNRFVAQKISEVFNEVDIPHIVIDEENLGIAMGACPIPGWRIRINEEDRERAEEIVRKVLEEEGEEEL